LNDVSQILPRPTPVAMATKFVTKLAITRLVYEISLRCLRLIGGFGVGLSNVVCQILQLLTLVVTATRFWDKIGYNSAYIRDIPEIFCV